MVSSFEKQLMQKKGKSSACVKGLLQAALFLCHMFNIYVLRGFIVALKMLFAFSHSGASRFLF